MTTDLSNLTELVNRLSDVESAIEAKEKELKQLNELKQQLGGVEIPEIFAASGLQELKLDDGRKVKVETFYSASLSMENPNRAKALEWLRKHNYDSIIKNQVIVGFNKGEDALAIKLQEQLTELGFNPIKMETVHPMTLKSFVKERIEAGEEFPRDDFKVYEGKQTKIK